MVNLLKDILRSVYAPLLNYAHDLLYGARRYRYLFQEIRHVQATRIMEIGTWNGNRAVQMITTAQAQAKPDDDIEYYGFDLFEALDENRFESEISKWPPNMTEVKSKLQQTNAQIHLYKGNTRESLPANYSLLPEMDFIFIDGGHSYETILNDWTYVSKLMHEKTTVIFDDYWRNRNDAGAKPVVDAIDRNKYTVVVLPRIDSFKNKDFGELQISFARVTLR